MCSLSRVHYSFIAVEGIPITTIIDKNDYRILEWINIFLFPFSSINEDDDRNFSNSFECSRMKGEGANSLEGKLTWCIVLVTGKKRSQVEKTERANTILHWGHDNVANGCERFCIVDVEGWRSTPEGKGLQKMSTTVLHQLTCIHRHKSKRASANPQHRDGRLKSHGDFRSSVFRFRELDHASDVPWQAPKHSSIDSLRIRLCLGSTFPRR